MPNFDFKKLVYSDINLDGGNVVFSPSKEKVIISDRVFSENHGISESELAAKLEKLLEASLIIIPSLKSDMTGHADGMVRFVVKIPLSLMLRCRRMDLKRKLKSLCKITDLMLLIFRIFTQRVTVPSVVILII